MDINSSRFKVELDNHITGGRYKRTMVDVVCKNCEHIFEWQVCYEYGMSWYEPEDVECPKCGKPYYDEDNESKEETE